MQILISIMIIGLLWMIYDLINAPEVDEDENFINPLSDDDFEEDVPENPAEIDEIKPEKKTSKID